MTIRCENRLYMLPYRRKYGLTYAHNSFICVEFGEHEKKGNKTATTYYYSKSSELSISTIYNLHTLQKLTPQ